MGIPWLKKKDEVAGSVSSPVQVRESDDGEDYDPMHAAAADLIDAVHSKNIHAVADALKAAFELANSSGEDNGQ